MLKRRLHICTAFKRTLDDSIELFDPLGGSFRTVSHVSKRYALHCPLLLDIICGWGLAGADRPRLITVAREHYLY